MIENPIKLRSSQMAVDIMKVLAEKNINAIPVIDDKEQVCGVIDIQDIPKFKVM